MTGAIFDFFPRWNARHFEIGIKIVEYGRKSQIYDFCVGSDRRERLPPNIDFLENHSRCRKTIRDSHLTRYPLWYTTSTMKSVMSGAKVSLVRMEWPFYLSR